MAHLQVSILFPKWELIKLLIMWLYTDIHEDQGSVTNSLKILFVTIILVKLFLYLLKKSLFLFFILNEKMLQKR